MRWTAVRTIDAAPDLVFRVVADPEEFHKVIPDGLSVEYLTPARSGVGMKFRATRLVNGSPAAFDQEVTEFVPGERLRMINVTRGTLWDGTFSVCWEANATVLTLTMDSVTDRLYARVMNFLIARMVQRSIDRDMDAVKAYCER
jgi:uncharacterized protein YndB with AHSA1/START domain